MISLPPALRAWRRELELFPRDVALSLGGWLPRLAASIGPMRSIESHEGDPDGLDGIAQRGPYERLVHSEWLLADEMPEEFLRRAASGEHAFTALARRRPGSRRRSLLLFDAGPDQLGAPRIVHLALLVVLGQRARAAGADLLWGVAQDPERICEEVSAESILSLLHARSVEQPARDAPTRWLSQVGAEPGDDVWLVGSASLRTDAVIGGLIEVSDVLAVDRHAVKVEMRVPGRLPAGVELVLPPRRTAIRLLRDPFDVAQPTAARATGGAMIAGSLRFTGDGRRILVRREDDSVVAWHVPQTPREPMGRPRVVHRSGELLGIERATRRKVVAAMLRDGVLVLSGHDRSGDLAFNAAPGLPQPQPAPEGRLVPLIKLNGVAPRWALLDDAAVLHILTVGATGRGVVSAYFEGVIALCKVHGGSGLAFWQRVRDRVVAFKLEGRSTNARECWRLPASAHAAVVCAGHNPYFGHPELGLFAVRPDVGDAWLIQEGPHPSRLEVDDGDEVLAVVAESHAEGPALVTVDGGGGLVKRRSRHGDRVVHITDTAIVHACSSPDGTRVAVVEESGVIWVASIEQGGPVLIVTPDEVVGA